MGYTDRHKTVAYYGAKTRQLQHLLPLLPLTASYVECCAGTASVFFAKRLSKATVLNDRDDILVNVLRVIRDKPNELAHALALTPNARSEFVACDYQTDDPVELARQALVAIKCSRQHVTADTKSYDYSISYKPHVKHFGRMAETILEMTDKLHHAQIECRPAVEVVDRASKEPVDTDILIYADPPYLPATRNQPSAYRCEMSIDDHTELLTALVASPHRVALSGYRSNLYDGMLAEWRRYEWDTHASTNTANTTRQECVWLNYDPHLGLL